MLFHAATTPSLTCHLLATVDYADRAVPLRQFLDRAAKLHEEHGLHVHLVSNQFIDVSHARELASQAGWGRIHVTRMPSEHAGYLAKYLSKERAECLNRWRLWAGFGKGWDWTKVKDVIRETLLSRVYRACKEWKGWTGRDGFFERMEFARGIMIATIENGWEVGRGPNDLPYCECGELLESA